MKEYRITWYKDDTQYSRIVSAASKSEAKRIGWQICDADDIYVSEVEE